jgi:alkylated DNA repair dioxygenase AlkB
MQLSLPIATPPTGLSYLPEFISPAEETELIGHLNTVQLQAVVMHGQAAKRTVAHFGVGYGYDSQKATASAPPLPPWLVALAAKVAPQLHAPTDGVDEVLVTKYPPGARIGWHRDAPAFGPAVAGLSLAGPCQLRLRHAHTGGDRGYDTHALDLPPRSLYVLAGPVRARWEHMVPPVPSLRWSITFRTLLAPERLPSRAMARRSGEG